MRVQQRESFCSLMTQTRSEANQQQSNTPWHCPSLNRDLLFAKGELPLALPVTREGRRLLINVLCLALGWILADGHAHPKPAMGHSWDFAPSASDTRGWWACSFWLQLW